MSLRALFAHAAIPRFLTCSYASGSTASQAMMNCKLKNYGAVNTALCLCSPSVLKYSRFSTSTHHRLSKAFQIAPLRLCGRKGYGDRWRRLGFAQSWGDVSPINSRTWEDSAAPPDTRSFRSSSAVDDREQASATASGNGNGAVHNGQLPGVGQVPLTLAVGPPRPLTGNADTQAYKRELNTVTVAITANLVIFMAKLVTYIFSGSSAMLAETVHSVVDTFNQVLLRVGIVRSRKAPTSQHPYGYLKDKFVWSLVSAVGIFCLGAGITTAHGFTSLMAGPQQLEHLGYGLSVLGLSFVVEGYSLFVATRAVMAGATANGLTFMQYLRRGLDPTSIAVMLEDGAAVAGLAIAAVSTGISHMTGNSIYDAIGSISIGVLLGCTALFLISQNRSLLIGRSMNTSEMMKVMNHLRKDSVVKAVHDAKSEEIGPGIYRFKAEIEFKGEKLVERHMDRLGGKERLQEQIYSAVLTTRRESLDMALMSYGKDMVGALGAEIDRLEAEIRQVVPGIRHIDLETDRGRHDKNATSSIGLYTVEADASQTQPQTQ